jgi:hypothetical protein
MKLPILRKRWSRLYEIENRTDLSSGFREEKKETGCGSDEKRCWVKFWVFYSGNERVKGRLITVWKKIKCERVIVLYEKDALGSDGRKCEEKG